MKYLSGDNVLSVIRNKRNVTNLFETKFGHNLPSLLLAPALLVLADTVLPEHSGGSGPLALATLSPGLLQLRDGVSVVSVRISAGVILLLISGLSVSNLGQFWHDDVL